MDLAAAHEDADDIDFAAAELRKIAPDAVSMSQSNVLQPLLAERPLGTYYSRLRAIRRIRSGRRLLLRLHHGVGSEDWSVTDSPAFNGTGRLQSPRRSDFFENC